MDYRACMYLRLSRDDGDSMESNSISNQRFLIKDYARKNGFEVLEEYVDDGFSGSNFERPSFKRMMESIEKKVFNMIIVKDLSRFGRDYIESGKYLQKVFPKMGVRFISINDNYDSENANVSDTHLILPIRNFINDSYCRDISMKVRSSQKVKREKGEYIGAFAPFGYLKDPLDKHHLIIDESVRSIIEEIFNLKVYGYSSTYIAKTLNEKGYLTPLQHKSQIKENYNVGFISTKPRWDAKMVNRIIQNKVYIGTLEQGKTTRLNYKTKKGISVLKDDWIVREDMHDPIISQEIYEMANKMLLRDITTGTTTPSLLTGLLFCADCGRMMIRRKQKVKSGERIFYICGGYNKGDGCSRHSIREDKILEVLSVLIRDHIELRIELFNSITNIDKIHKPQIALDGLNNEKKRFEILRKSLSDDLEQGLIDENEFNHFRKVYIDKVREVDKQIELQKKIEQDLEKKLKEKDLWIRKLLSLKTLSSFNRETIISLIDRIEIGENKTIHVVFNDVGEINCLKEIISGKELDTNSNVISMSESVTSTLSLDENSAEGRV